MKPLVLLLGSIWVSLASPTAAAPAPRYVLTDLGTLPGGTYSIALGLNDKGQVVGGADTAKGEAHAVFWENGKAADLGTLPGQTISIARAINSRGEIAGESSAANKEIHAVLWIKGVPRDLGSVGRYGEVTGINNRGQIIARFHDIGEASQPKGRLWENGRWRDLDSPDGRPHGINNQGRIVGSIDVGIFGNFAGRAFAWQQERALYLKAMPGRSPGEMDSQAIALNNKGQVIGTIQESDKSGHRQERTFLWSHDSLTFLDTLNGDAQAINDSAQIVGSFYLPTDGKASRALLWQRGQSYNLNTLAPAPPGLVLETSQAINNAGQIVGFAERAGKGRGFLLTPK